jgi:uncharacterized protein
MSKIKKNIILESVKQRIWLVDAEAKIILFGSRARNEATTLSDWDFLILTKKKVNLNLKKQITNQLITLEQQSAQVFSTIVRNIDDWNTKYQVTDLYKNITKEGVEI